MVNRAGAGVSGLGLDFTRVRSASSRSFWCCPMPFSGGVRAGFLFSLQDLIFPTCVFGRTTYHPSLVNRDVNKSFSDLQLHIHARMADSLSLRRTQSTIGFVD